MKYCNYKGLSGIKNSRTKSQREYYDHLNRVKIAFLLGKSRVLRILKTKFFRGVMRKLLGEFKGLVIVNFRVSYFYISKILLVLRVKVLGRQNILHTLP